MREGGEAVNKQKPGVTLFSGKQTIYLLVIGFDDGK